MGKMRKVYEEITTNRIFLALISILWWGQLVKGLAILALRKAFFSLPHYDCACMQQALMG